MNMRKYIFATAASLLMTTSLNAADYSVKNSDGQYITIYAGINELQNLEFATDVPIYNGIVTISGNIKNDWGFDVGQTVGGRIGGPIFSKETFPLLGKITGEIEGSISKADIDSIDISQTATITAHGAAADISLGGGSYPVDGKVEFVIFILTRITVQK